MSRIKLHRISAASFLSNVRDLTGMTYSTLASICNVNRRSFSDWSNGKSLMPLGVFKKLRILSGRKPGFTVLSEYWNNKTSASAGGRLRNKLRGNPGTPEGRALGGRKTYKLFLKDPSLARRSGFKIAQEIVHPRRSVAMAELFGIILGDGGITPYQLTISLNKETDKDYGTYVKCLISRLFGIMPSLHRRDSVLQIVASSVNIVRFLLKNGLHIGSKVKRQAGVPEWIGSSDKYLRLCIRGLMDTDGCFFLDHHRYKSRKYVNPALSFTNRSLPLLGSFKSGLDRYGLHPTQSTKYTVFLRKRCEIERYFKVIGSSNNKHIKKFRAYISKN